MKTSAGILLYRKNGTETQYFLVHPGGPIWKNKDAGAWSIPKGIFDNDEDAFAAAQREFHEETGFRVEGNFIKLTPVKQKSGKWVHAWAVEGDIDPAKVRSNTFLLQWPPRSGKYIEVPEIDRGEWFTESDVKVKMIPAQTALVDELVNIFKMSATR